MRNYLTRANDNFGLNLFDVFDDFFKPTFFGGAVSNMRTDIRESETGYDFSIDMPGFDKKDISLTLDKGYLTVSAEKAVKEDDNFVRRERVSSYKRSYYVGDRISETDVKAKYENGVLSLFVPKLKEVIPEKKNIEIE